MLRFGQVQQTVPTHRMSQYQHLVLPHQESLAIQEINILDFIHLVVKSVEVQAVLSDDDFCDEDSLMVLTNDFYCIPNFL
jgi:hypothetical protein